MTFTALLTSAGLILGTLAFITHVEGEPASSAQPAPAVKLQALAWMAGSWETVPTKAGAMTEEYWTSADGTVMMGVARTNRLDTTVFYEHMMIETRVDGLYYVVQPKGQEKAEFKLVKSGEREVTFENPKHDFPTRIIYRRTSDTELLARIEGERDGKPASLEFVFKKTARNNP